MKKIALNHSLGLKTIVEYEEETSFRKFAMNELEEHFKPFKDITLYHYNAGDVSKCYPIRDNNNELFWSRLQDNFENQMSKLVIFFLCDETVGDKFKSAEDCEIGLRNHMAHHVHNAWSGMWSDPCA